MTTNACPGKDFRLRPWISAAALALLVACGGGGGTATAPSPAGATGSIGITLGDSPADDFDEILLTVSRVELLGGEGGEPVLISNETMTVDLLALDAATELLVAADDVPAGQYSKIRLQLEGIELRRLDDKGDLKGEPVAARLRANGKLDLNPRGPFSIIDGGVVIVQLDVDARRSFLTVQTSSGQVRFRPVVFVDVLGDGDLRRITFLAGDVRLLGAPEGDRAFDLCNARPLTGRGNGDRQLDECRRTVLTQDASLFSANAEPISLADVDDQAAAVVAGRIVVTDGEVGFEALMLQLGDRANFKRIAGVIQGAVVDGRFTLADEDAAAEEGIIVQVQAGALLFDQAGNVLELDALAAGVEVRVMGSFVDSEVEGEVGELRATAIAVDADSASDSDASDTEQTLRGSITDITEGRLDVELEGSAASACVLFNAETTINVNESDGESVNSLAGSADDFELGAQVEAIGEVESGAVDDCLTARGIVIEIEV